ncbi:DUF3369 domain-containing protein [Dongshaea marina]|uniref:DUF3369 domain-containing protein n=1 Tax=Dongshaea marina TaxID=2047966 RepID=UPI000D3E88F3|nr:DUF3369 domain-containing protein [Dongshaea marina]
MTDACFEDTGPLATLTDEPVWKVAVVDDEDDIHSLTQMVLKGKSFFGRKLEILDAYSGADARIILRDNPDTALVLLDVVMETDHEGLEVAKYIRESLNNRLTRITLRTGQPGQAPELDTVINYDINDYKEKTELTSKKLITAIYIALRSYRDMLSIEDTKENIKKLIQSAHHIYHSHAIKDFSSHVLQQMVVLLNLGSDALYFKMKDRRSDDDYLSREVLAGIGKFASSKNCDDLRLSDRFNRELTEVRINKSIMVYDDHFFVYFCSRSGAEHILYACGSKCESLSDERNRELIHLFCNHIGDAFEMFYPGGEEVLLPGEQQSKPN